MLENVPIGLVPLNWKYSAANISAYLEGIAGYGFEGIQIGKEQGDNPEFVSKLAQLKLKSAEHYVAIRCNTDGPIDGFLAEYLEQISFSAHHNVEMMVLAVDGSIDREKVAGRVTSIDAMSDKGFAALARIMEQIAEAGLKVGIPSSFHPHAATYIETPEETQALLDLVDSELVSVCLDTGHWIMGGGDPVAAVEHFGSRITHVHVKDVNADVKERVLAGKFELMEDAVQQEKLFLPAGTGALDLQGFLRALDKINYKGWLMSEQDSAHEPSEAASGISMHNIKKTLAL